MSEIKMPKKNPKVATLEGMYTPEFIDEDKRKSDEILKETNGYNEIYSRKHDKAMRNFIDSEFKTVINTVIEDLDKLGFTDITYEIDPNQPCVEFRALHSNQKITNKFLIDVHDGNSWNRYVTGMRGYEGTSRTIVYESRYGELSRGFPDVSTNETTWNGRDKIREAQRMIKEYGHITPDEKKKIISTFEGWSEQQTAKERNNHISEYRTAVNTVNSAMYNITEIRKNIQKLENEISEKIQKATDASATLKKEKKWLEENGIKVDGYGYTIEGI